MLDWGSDALAQPLAERYRDHPLKGNHRNRWYISVRLLTRSTMLDMDSRVRVARAIAKDETQASIGVIRVPHFGLDRAAAS